MKLALTFDDGPDPVWTPKVLEVLGKFGVLGTFFVLGDHVNKFPEVLKEVVKAGHQVGNHGMTHTCMVGMPSGVATWELLNCQNAVFLASEKVPKWFRPPYGQTDRQVETCALTLGLKQVLWDVSTGDWSAISADEIVRRVEKSDGGVILMHDSSPEGDRSRQFTVDALGQVLEMYPKESFVGLGEIYG